MGGFGDLRDRSDSDSAEDTERKAGARTQEDIDGVAASEERLILKQISKRIIAMGLLYQGLVMRYYGGCNEFVRGWGIVDI